MTDELPRSFGIGGAGNIRTRANSNADLAMTPAMSVPRRRSSVTTSSSSSSWQRKNKLIGGMKDLFRRSSTTSHKESAEELERTTSEPSQEGSSRSD